MKLRFLPDQSRNLLSLVWASLTKVNPLNSRLIFILAILLFLTDVGYEGQRSPDRILTLVLFSTTSIALFFTIYFGLVYLARNIPSGTSRGIFQFAVVIIAEACKSALLIYLFRPEIFLSHYFERLPGDITLAALYWLTAAVVLSTSEDHVSALAQLNKASERLVQQRNVTLRTATEVEQELHRKASSVLLGDLDRLAILSREIMDSAKASEVKLEIQRLVRNHVRPLSRELRSRVEVLENFSPPAAPIAKLSTLRIIPKKDASYIVSYLIAMPNVFFTLLTKSDFTTSLLLLAVSFSIPIVGRLVQNLLPNQLMKVTRALFLSGLVSVFCYLPLGYAISIFAQNWSSLSVTVFTAGGVLLLTCLMTTSWFALQRERLAIVEEIKRVNREAKHDLDLLNQSLWLAQRKWSYLIHGTVQAALTVASSRLELAQRPDERLRVQVESDINRAKQALTSPPEFSGDPSELLQEIAATWEGVCNFTYQISASALHALSQSPTSTICFIEILKELVSNASRHGGATKFWLNAYLNAEGDLAMIAGNNGKPVPSDISAGLGFQMITDLTKDWEIDRKAAGFSATLPMPKVTTSF